MEDSSIRKLKNKNKSLLTVKKNKTASFISKIQQHQGIGGIGKQHRKDFALSLKDRISCLQNTSVSQCM